MTQMNKNGETQISSTPFQANQAGAALSYSSHAPSVFPFKNVT